MRNAIPIPNTPITVTRGKLSQTWLVQLGSNRALTLIAFSMGIAVMLMYQPFSLTEGGDAAIWDYVAQSIVRGQVPYRDVIDNKAPGAGYLSAAVMAAGKLIRLQDVLAVRLFYVVLTGLLCALTYLVAEAYLRSRLAAVLAFLIPLMSKDFAIMLIAGTCPKLPMTLFGLATLLLIYRNRPFWAGFCSMLACLCWQPGLLFTGTAVLMFSRYLTSWRDLRALKVLLGASIPLAVTLFYFHSVGALDDLFACTIHYNYSVYFPDGNVGPGIALARLWYQIDTAMGSNVVWVGLGVLGFLVFGFKCLWTRFKRKSGSGPKQLFEEAIVIPMLVYLIFRAINFPGEDDLIPMFPFIGIFAGFFIVELSRLLASIGYVRGNPLANRVVRGTPVIPICLAIFLTLDQAARFRIEPDRTLRYQQAAFKAVSDVLGADDKIYVHGTLELLVLLNRPNLNRYIFLARGTDDYVAAKLPRGFKGLIDAMEAEAPKVISLSRVRNVAHGDELLEWASHHYEKLPLEFAHNSVYVRKQNQ